MANFATLLASAAVGAAIRPHVRTIAKTALTGFYVTKRHASELASRVTEELEDIHAEVLNEKSAAEAAAAQAASTVTADGVSSEQASQNCSGADAATINLAPEDPKVTACDEQPPAATVEPEPELKAAKRLGSELISFGVGLGSRVKKSDLLGRLQSAAAAAAQASGADVDTSQQQAAAAGSPPV